MREFMPVNAAKVVRDRAQRFEEVQQGFRWQQPARKKLSLFGNLLA